MQKNAITELSFILNGFSGNLKQDAHDSTYRVTEVGSGVIRYDFSNGDRVVVKTRMNNALNHFKDSKCVVEFWDKSSCNSSLPGYSKIDWPTVVPFLALAVCGKVATHNVSTIVPDMWQVNVIDHAFSVLQAIYEAEYKRKELPTGKYMSLQFIGRVFKATDERTNGDTKAQWCHLDSEIHELYDAVKKFITDKNTFGIREAAIRHVMDEFADVFNCSLAIVGYNIHTYVQQQQTTGAFIIWASQLAELLLPAIKLLQIVIDSSVYEWSKHEIAECNENDEVSKAVEDVIRRMISLKTWASESVLFIKKTTKEEVQDEAD